MYVRYPPSQIWAGCLQSTIAVIIGDERTEPKLVAKLAAEARTDLSPRSPLFNRHEVLLHIDQADTIGEARLDLISIKRS